MKLVLILFLLSASVAIAQEEPNTPFNRFSKKAKEVGKKSVEELKKAKARIVGEDKKEVIEDTPKVETKENPPETKVEPVDAKVEAIPVPPPPAHQETVIEKAEKKVEVISKKMDETRYLREDSTGTFMFSYQPITTWMPSKKALSYTHIFSRNWTTEFEYAWASISFPVFGIDLGEISEKRYTLQARRYFGNSFHLLFGAYKNEFNVRVGNDVLNRMGAKSIDAFSVENMGGTLGIGNRWQFKNGFTWGIDWFRVNVPLFNKKTDDKILRNVSDEGDAEDIKKVSRRFESFPTFVLLGLSLGYTF